MKLIITSISAYKEKDAIMNGVSEEGVFTFRVPGLYSPKNKFVSLNNALTIIEPTFSESKSTKKLTLQEAVLLFSPMSGQMDFHYVTAIATLTEATSQLLDDEERGKIYNDLYQAIYALKDKVNPYFVILKYLTAVMNNSGFAMNVNGCNRCGEKKGIVAFNFIEGGFICKNCFTNEDKNDLEIPEMKVFRNIYLHQGYDFKDDEFDQKIVISLLKKINIFIADGYGYSMKSFNNL